jgi:hypothetical protein
MYVRKLPEFQGFQREVVDQQPHYIFSDNPRNRGKVSFEGQARTSISRRE